LAHTDIFITVFSPSEGIIFSAVNLSLNPWP